jgi:hypothetical protein
VFANPTSHYNSGLLGASGHGGELTWPRYVELARSTQAIQSEIDGWLPEHEEFLSLVHGCNSKWVLIATDVRSRLSEHGVS